MEAVLFMSLAIGGVLVFTALLSIAAVMDELQRPER